MLSSNAAAGKDIVLTWTVSLNQHVLLYSAFDCCGHQVCCLILEYITSYAGQGFHPACIHRCLADATRCTFLKSMHQVLAMLFENCLQCIVDALVECSKPYLPSYFTNAMGCIQDVYLPHLLQVPVQSFIAFQFVDDLASTPPRYQ